MAKMVHVTTLIFALAAVSTAVPTASSQKEIIQPGFSFATWTESRITDPTAARNVEALEKYRATQKRDTKRKRQTFSSCEQKGDQPALVSDAVECVQELAGRGAEGQQCDVSSAAKSQCRRRFAQIVTVKAYLDRGPTSMNCNDIARAVALILDSCTRDGMTVTGESNIDSIAVHLQEPLILKAFD
ncbi:hypothetical protein BDU57DRAFT_538803 [Ampelomyces quisqualis]|uniref:Uncharacterized protein n=1 Tax=Ampelomyces quisqualis TaxID=50730 RepID=A0A6A5QPQ6_AMPQU|nr:hypothetical protein BDU57DRAFT_538803 [Ampelomyces quisqualis]